MGHQGSTQDRPESVAIPVDGDRIEGDLVLPAGTIGLVLFAHGSGSSRYSPRNRYVADLLNQTGLGTLLLDLLTQREDAEDRITGEYRFDIGLLARRLLAATDWICDQPSLRSRPLGYFGASTGAAAALAAAAKRPRVVKAVVSRGGRPDLADNDLPQVQAPTLLIVGGDDGPVIDLNRQAMAQMRCRNRLEIVPDATHLFEEPGKLDEVAQLAGRWFLTHFDSGTAGDTGKG